KPLVGRLVKQHEADIQNYIQRFLQRHLEKLKQKNS
ncbi:hypothetical protein DBR06_SOUSAS1810157, partial [Sousa chinensis]